MKKLLSVVLITYLVIAEIAFGCPTEGDGGGGGDCRKCIVNKMKYDCTACRGMLRCMAKCLWGGIAKLSCQKRCNCSSSKDDYPNLSDCKKCMLNCKCACIS